MVQRLAVLVERREQRLAELEIGHVELDLGEVDGLGLAQPVLGQMRPGPGIQRLVLPERRPGDADIRSVDDDAVDMAAQPAAGRHEAELAAIAALGPEHEAGGPQPARRQHLELVADIEDAQHPAVEVGDP